MFSCQVADPDHLAYLNPPLSQTAAAAAASSLPGHFTTFNDDQARELVHVSRADLAFSLLKLTRSTLLPGLPIIGRESCGLRSTVLPGLPP